MRFLIISYHSPLSSNTGGRRAFQIAKYLSDKGHSCFLLSKTHSSYNIDEFISDPKSFTRHNPHRGTLASLLWRMISTKTLVTRISFLKRMVRNFAWIPDPQILWNRTAYRLASQKILDNGFDLLYVSVPPFSSLQLGSKLARNFNIPWVCEYRDLWLENHYYKYSSIFKWFYRNLETRWVTSADAVITVSETLASKLAHFSQEVYVVLNGYDSGALYRPENIKRDSAKLYIAYTGTIYYDKYDWHSFVGALKKLAESGRNFSVTLAGQNLNFLLNALKRAGLSSLIDYRGSVAHAEAVGIQRASDCLMFFTWPDEEGIWTSKLAEYIGASKYVAMVGKPSDVSAFVDSLGGCCLSSDTESLYLNLSDLCDTKEAKRQIRVNRDKKKLRIFSCEYQFRKLEQKLLELGRSL